MADKQKKATDNISCPACQQVFKKPKYLPCYHYFCEECLEKVQVQSKVACPKCKKEATVPTGGIKELKTNLFISSLVEDFNLKCKVEGEAEVKCDECLGDDPVENFCPDCIMFLCHVCNQHHKRSAKSRDHCTLTLTELRSNKDVNIQPKEKVLLCTEHDYELKHYCESCDELICLYCTVKEHNDHSHNTIKNLATKHRQELSKITNPIHEMIKSLSKAYEKIEDTMVKETKEQVDELHKTIDQHYDMVVQKLIEQKKKLKQKVQNTLSQPFKPQLDEVRNAQEAVLIMKQLINAVQNSSDQQFFSAKRQMMADMQELNEKYQNINLEPVKPTSTSKIEFVPTEEPFPQFGLLYTTANPDPQQCEIVDVPEYISYGSLTEFTVITKDKNGIRCSKGGNQVGLSLRGQFISVKDRNDGSYVASIAPRIIGRASLQLTVNGGYKQQCYDTDIVYNYNITCVSEIVDDDGGMGKPWGIAFGEYGMWAVTDDCYHCVYVFDRFNTFKACFGQRGKFEGDLFHPRGIAFDRYNNIYVADTYNHRIQKFNIQGRYLLDFHVQSCIGVVVKFNKIYVARHNCISVYLGDDRYECSYDGNSKFVSIYGIALCANQLIISDIGCSGNGACVHILTLDGDYVAEFGRGDLRNPYQAMVDYCGFLVVADSSCVAVFDKNGKKIHCFSSNDKRSRKISSLCGIALCNNAIYVTDYNNQQVQIFNF